MYHLYASYRSKSSANIHSYGHYFFAVVVSGFVVVVVVVVICLFSNNASPYTSCWFGAFYVEKASLKLAMLHLPVPPNYWARHHTWGIVSYFT